MASSSSKWWIFGVCSGGRRSASHYWGWSIPFTIAASFLPICAAWARRSLRFTAKVTTTPRRAKPRAVNPGGFPPNSKADLLSHLTWRERRSTSPLLDVKRLVGGAEQLFDSGAVARKFGNADAHRDARLFRILRQSLGHALGHNRGRFCCAFRQHQGKFVSPVPRCRVRFTAAQVQYFGHPANRHAAHHVPVLVIDFFQSIEVQQQNRECLGRAPITSDLLPDALHQQSIVRQARQRIPHGQHPGVFLLP